MAGTISQRYPATQMMQGQGRTHIIHSRHHSTPFPNPTQPPKSGPSPSCRKPQPQPPTHFHCTHFSIPPTCQVGHWSLSQPHVSRNATHIVETRKPVQQREQPPNKGCCCPETPRYMLWQPAGTWGEESPPGKASEGVGSLRQGLLLSFPTSVSSTDKLRFGWINCDVPLSPISA